MSSAYTEMADSPSLHSLLQSTDTRQLLRPLPHCWGPPARHGTSCAQLTICNLELACFTVAILPLVDVGRFVF